jgi:hypothetical protein
VSDDRAPTFLHRLFEPEAVARSVARWPAVTFDPWDGGEKETSHQGNLAKIAASATGAELRRILRSGNDRVLLAVLDNPAINHDDVVKIAESPKAGPQVLGGIARRKRWSSDRSLAKALCLNGKTPFYASRSLLLRLNMRDLRDVTKSTVVPPALAKEAHHLIDKKRSRS